MSENKWHKAAGRPVSSRSDAPKTSRDWGNPRCFPFKLWETNVGGASQARPAALEIPLSRSRTYISSPEPPSFVLWLPNWAQSRRLWLSSRWCSDNVMLEVSWSNSNVTWYRKWSQCNCLMNCRLTTAPFLQFFTLKRAQSKRGKSENFTQKSTEKGGQNRGPCGHRYRSWMLQTWRLLFGTPNNQVSKHR